MHPQPPPARLPHEAQVALHALEHPVQVRQALVRVPVELGVHLVLAEAPEQQPQAAQEELGQRVEVGVLLHAAVHGVEHVDAPLPPGPLLEVDVIRAVPQPDRLLLVESHEALMP